ncbi:MAG TPA: efflux RND transporter periplasmic adaptor subunit [Kofleriaceae bacterium]|nr:efflux RND transporter periplasmic adaptor subunit [Kofleriaceae bacterium]
MRARLETTSLLLLPGLLAALVGCRGEAAPPPPRPPSVVLVKVVQKDVPIESEWIATLDGHVNADIQPQVTGYLVRQVYAEGMQVRKGDVLFEIDARPFRASLDQAQAQHAQSRAQLGKAAQDLERDRPLAEARAIAKSQLDNDVQAKRAAKAATDSARATVKQARLNLEFTRIRSPINGIAGIARGQIGDLVGPTTVLTTVSQVDPIKAYVAISEQEYLSLGEVVAGGSQPLPGGVGAGLSLLLGDGNVYPHQGRFVLADRQVDSTTGTIRLVATFPNPKRLLRPGQFGRVRAVTRVVKGALIIPQRAVTELQGTFQVAVVGADDKAVVRPVELGPRVGSMWIVEKGLRAGERVVAEGVQKVKDGAPVTPAAAPAPDGKGG